jgi:CDP-diacylglycerol--serine O-phosphatidyltransferase
MTMSAFRFLQIDQIESTRMRLDHAAIAIGLAGVCDILDGRIARMTKTATEIGIQLDSLADIVSFGLAPAFLAYVWGFGNSGRMEQRRQFAWFVSSCL